ncbi:hypothetical protein [Flavobacterium sp. JP2137]|uniref:hypothetical protein n=1 Tax=Flavobacterium sp. JP2137 TaxID=3414510 RepID=UPI003D300BF2
METKLKDIKLEIEQIIQNINDIISEEDFSAYHTIKNYLNKMTDCILEYKIIDANKYLGFCIRSIMEAPPKNEQLGLDTLTRMDTLYKKLIVLLD